MLPVEWRRGLVAKEFSRPWAEAAVRAVRRMSVLVAALKSDILASGGGWERTGMRRTVPSWGAAVGESML